VLGGDPSVADRGDHKAQRIAPQAIARAHRFGELDPKGFRE
jgi:hypothetical protein